MMHSQQRHTPRSAIIIVCIIRMRLISGRRNERQSDRTARHARRHRPFKYMLHGCLRKERMADHALQCVSDYTCEPSNIPRSQCRRVLLLSRRDATRRSRHMPTNKELPRSKVVDGGGIVC